MIAAALPPLGRSLTIVAASAVLGACGSDTPVAPDRAPTAGASLTTLPGTDTDGAIAPLQRVTARYHTLQAALDATRTARAEAAIPTVVGAMITLRSGYFVNNA